MEKTSIIKKSTTQKVSTPAEIPAGAGTDTGKENVFSRKQSMSQSKTMGEGIRIDYTLAFVKWIGDHHPFIKDEIRNDPINVLKYLAACDLIMRAYRNGKIESFIEKFILSRNINDIQNVKLVDENKLKNLSDTEKSMILTKYISLLLPHIKENSYRINASLVHSAILEMNPEELDSMANLYIEHIKHIQKLKEPKSVLQLYNENDKGAAFAKWLAESKPYVLPHITDLNDRYIVFSSNAFYERIASPQLAQEFEKAIANKDESVTKVIHSRFEIVKEKLADVIGNKKFFLVLLMIIPVIGIIVFIKIKKKKQRKENNTMKTLTCIILTFILLLPLSTMAEQPQQQQIPLNELVLPNFVYDHCHLTEPLYKVIELDEGFVNEIGSELAPTSCKGKVCWSWKILKDGDSIFAWQIFDSTLPLKISNVEKISKSISQIIKQTKSLRENNSNLINASRKFLKSSFSTSEEKRTTKERSLTESKSQEQASELNITPMFHKYLGMALQGSYVTAYYFCISSAADLFLKAYENDRVNDLVEAFAIFKTIKPEDIEFSKSKTMLNRAKFLFSISGEYATEKKFAWAQATLFAKLLEWPEFAQVKTTVDEYIDKVYNTYTMMKTKTTKEIAAQDKLLAGVKLATDKYITENNLQPDAIEDKYAFAAVNYYRYNYHKETLKKVVEMITQDLDKAMQNNDQILTAKLIKPKNYYRKDSKK